MVTGQNTKMQIRQTKIETVCSQVRTEEKSLAPLQHMEGEKDAPFLTFLLKPYAQCRVFK